MNIYLLLQDGQQMSGRFSGIFTSRKDARVKKQMAQKAKSVTGKVTIGRFQLNLGNADVVR